MLTKNNTVGQWQYTMGLRNLVTANSPVLHSIFGDLTAQRIISAGETNILSGGGSSDKTITFPIEGLVEGKKYDIYHSIGNKKIVIATFVYRGSFTIGTWIKKDSFDIKKSLSIRVHIGLANQIVQSIKERAANLDKKEESINNNPVK